jgi:hypothetical protein
MKSALFDTISMRKRIGVALRPCCVWIFFLTDVFSSHFRLKQDPFDSRPVIYKL